MRQYNADNLVIRRGNSPDPDTIVEVRPEEAGWRTIHFQARRLSEDRSLTVDTRDQEMALVVLGGCIDVLSSRGEWRGIGGRPGVFAGLPHALYLPRATKFEVRAATPCEFAMARVAVDRDYPPRLVTPSEVRVEIRGGGHATRQINSILPPGFPCARLVVVEVYTPGGNWSSYPPHKHDIHKIGPQDRVLEADLDEIYYYRIDPPGGYALQRVYTDPESPLHRSGYPIDAAVVARDSDVVLIPEGYHPVSCPVGYTAYYLNILAGSAQSLACTDDPHHAWIKETYGPPDPRVPVYKVSRKEGS